jgi:hypothetical protein
VYGLKAIATNLIGFLTIHVVIASFLNDNMTTFEKLAVKIEEDLGLKITNLKRTYAGLHQRSSGAFVWTAECVESKEDIGSTITASDLLKRDKIEEMEMPTLSSLRELI